MEFTAGNIFNALTFTGRKEVKDSRAYVECVCVCGSTVLIRSDRFTSARSKPTSCGCATQELKRMKAVKHGAIRKGVRTRLYRIYGNIKQRCENERASGYSHYGGRGIKCEFENFTEFQTWATLNGYNDDLTIERKDNDGNYSADNCIWIPYALQNRNSRHNVLDEATVSCIKTWIKYSGLGNKAIAKIFNVHKQNIYDLKKGNAWADVSNLPV